MRPEPRHRTSRLVWVALALALGCESEQVTGPDGGLRADFLAACIRSEDCASGLCVDAPTARGVGFCSQRCDSDAACPAGANWRCAAPDGVGAPICLCVPDGDGEACGDGRDNDCDGATDDCRVCDGQSVRPDDPLHCGECFRACGAEQECRSGTCVCSRGGRAACGDECADLRVDEAHCGACGRSCGAGQRCEDGACACESELTPDLCDGVGCVDLASDPTNCGRCGRTCRSDELCHDGDCGCPATLPDACGAECVSLARDAEHCGACGRECAAHLACVDGRCACAAGTTDCGTTCVDLSRSTEHCGACGAACRPGETCAGGVCTCASGLVCGGVCRAVDDPEHCGGCGIACGATEVCEGGRCGCWGSAETSCDGRCVDLRYSSTDCGACGATCGAGRYCDLGTCRCAGWGETFCAAAGGGEGACVSLSDDAAHCGGCGFACPSGTVCSGGSCRCASAAQTFCGRDVGCVDLRSSDDHCGACGASCLGDQTCTYSRCACETYGAVYCPDAGRCIDVLEDEANCGFCGNACAEGLVCHDGGCVCEVYGDAYCASTGRCERIASDPEHCGECGRACVEGATCAGYVCRCTELGTTPCEEGCVDLRSDPDHCGSCGARCTGGRSCYASECLCGVPRLGAELPVVRGFDDDFIEMLDAASNGSEVAVLYSVSGEGFGNLYLAVHNSDGTAHLTTDVALTSFTGEIETAGDIIDGQVAWNGSEWAVVYSFSYATSEYSSETDTTLVRVTETGGFVVGGSVRLGDLFKVRLAGVGLELAHRPSFGYLVFGLRSDEIVRIDEDLGGGEGPWRLGIVADHVAFRGSAEIGTTHRDEFARLNADGTRTKSTRTVYGTSSTRLGTLLHDGSQWIAALTTNPAGAFGTDVRIAYGEDLERSVSIGRLDSTAPAYGAAGVRLVERGDDELVVVWRHYAAGVLARRIERSTYAPIDATTTLLPDASADDGLWAFGMEDGRVTIVWEDTGDGVYGFAEPFIVAVEYPDCPTP